MHAYTKLSFFFCQTIVKPSCIDRHSYAFLLIDLNHLSGVISLSSGAGLDIDLSS